METDKCKAIYRQKYAVMDGAQCDLPEGHTGDHKCNAGIVSGTFGPDGAKLITDGSQGWYWPQSKQQ